MILTKEELDTIRARAEAATKGPWKQVIHLGPEPKGFESDKWHAQGPDVIESQAKKDSEFIAASRTDITRLIESHEELRCKLGYSMGELIGQEHRLGTMLEMREKEILELKANTEADKRIIAQLENQNWLAAERENKLEKKLRDAVSALNWYAFEVVYDHDGEFISKKARECLVRLK